MGSSQKNSKTFLSPLTQAYGLIHGTGELSSSSPSEGTPPSLLSPPIRQHGALRRSPHGKPLFLFTYTRFILIFSPENLDSHQKTLWSCCCPLEPRSGPSVKSLRVSGLVPASRADCYREVPGISR
uniref:Uncharacterized protein n=1 Tax=Myotis myotis TaxID=51298 RepID=A0A7J7Z5P3_MYOMY|nr:hypothetical protein mMyoMyo1_010426 [Myotis myotis]